MSDHACIACGVTLHGYYQGLECPSGSAHDFVRATTDTEEDR